MKIKHKPNKYNVILLIIAVIIIGIVILYTSITQEQFEQSSYDSVEQSIEKISNEIDTNITFANRSIQLISHLVTQTMTGPEFENPNDILSSLKKQSPFDFIEYINKDGINCTDKGAPFDASDREYFKQGIKGKTGIWINYHPKYSKEFLLNFYTPLYYQDEIVGVLTGALGSNTNMLPLLHCSFLGQDTIGVLVEKDGHVFSYTENKALDSNFYLSDLLKERGIDSNVKKSIYKQLKNKDNSAFRIDGDNGKSIACVYTNESTGWYIIQIVPAKSFQSMMHQKLNSGYAVTFFVIILLLVYFIYVRVDSRKKHDEILEAKDKIVKDYEQILLTTASDTSKAIRRVDLASEKAEYIYFENGQLIHLDLGDWQEWLKTQGHYIHPEDCDRVISFMDIKHLRDMQEGNTYQENYRSASRNENGYHRTYTTVASMSTVNGRKVAILTTIDNTTTVMYEVEQRRLLVSAASIYISMHVMDIKNDVLEPLKTAPHISEIIGDRKHNIAQILKDVMQLLTDQEYVDVMMDFIDFNTLNDRMAGVNTITLEFLGLHTGWCRARFIAIDYDTNQKLSRVLWVVENIDAEKQKSNRLQYLSETDLMTGIRNRGSGERKIKELLEVNHTGLFCLLDADKFKSINDDFGHGVGDKVLIAMANCLKKAFHDADVVMRLGGDEFATFMKDITEIDQAVKLIEDFFENINAIDIPELGNRKISVSLGAAIKKQTDDWNFEELYKNADTCTYKSKKTEGNSYTFFEK